MLIIKFIFIKYLYIFQAFIPGLTPSI